MKTEIEQGRHVAKQLADLVNGLGKEDRKAFVDELTSRTHRTLQQQTMGLFLECCEAWADHERIHQYDARNEFTVKLAKDIMQLERLHGMASVPLI